MQFIRTEGECVPAFPQDGDRGQCLSFLSRDEHREHRTERSPSQMNRDERGGRQ